MLQYDTSYVLSTVGRLVSVRAMLHCCPDAQQQGDGELGKWYKCMSGSTSPTCHSSMRDGTKRLAKSLAARKSGVSEVLGTVKVLV